MYSGRYHITQKKAKKQKFKYVNFMARWLRKNVNASKNSF